ncbi:uncharacterized protein PAC_12224 [Phialocephala subalpina]|uniref:Carbohydrate-binding module family 19 domain-containing protein n=1 Tax=Phialocephala subalpina TaxID=576137 RepID=A0A1L7XBI2_9HELO|nr:uncharacterized protein PAC_12224 [Phialocephala subalpina]
MIVYTTFLSATYASPVASVLDERQACVPGTYSCSGDIVDIVVCDHGGRWITAALCGPNSFCHFINGIPFCS